MANSKSLGEVLRDARVKTDMSLRDLAKKLDITPSYISDIENDRRVPAEEVLQLFADALGLDHDDLMAMAGRIGEGAERYLKKEPAAGVLFRRISDKGLKSDDIQKLIRAVEKMPDKKGQG
jgi:transcriptional regulator with XRE-family HTH domain